MDNKKLLRLTKKREHKLKNTLNVEITEKKSRGKDTWKIDSMWVYFGKTGLPQLLHLKASPFLQCHQTDFPERNELAERNFIRREDLARIISVNKQTKKDVVIFYLWKAVCHT